MKGMARRGEFRIKVRRYTDPPAGMLPRRGLRAGLPALLLSLAVAGAPRCATEAAATPLGPATADLLRQGAGAQGDPQSDVVILYRGTHYKLDPDGRIERRVRQVERLLTDHAVTLRGDQRVAYDATRQELAVHVCRTFMRDGKEVVALPRAFNLTTPERVASCPERTDIQEMVISFLGVETGCLIELDYTVRDRAPWRPWLEGIEEIGAVAPVLEQEIVIDCPPGATVRAARIENGAVAPAGVDPRETMRWTALPAHPDEGGYPAALGLPRLVFTTCASWEALQAWLDGRIATAAAPDPAIKAWSEDDPPGGRPPLDARGRTERVAGLLGERINKADDLSLDWWLPIRSAARTFDTSCGNLLDRVALAVSAIESMGEDSRVILRPATPVLAREVPALCQFDDVWIATDSGTLDAGTSAFGPRPDPAHAEEILDRSSGKPHFAPLPPRKGSSFLSLHLREGDDGSFTGDAVVRVGGALCRGLDSSDLNGLLDGLAGQYARSASVARSRIDTFSADTLAVTFSFSGSGIGDSLGGGRSRFPFPSAPGLPDGALPGGLSLNRVARTTPISLPILVTEEVRVRIDLASRSRALILPPSRRLAGGGATLETSVERTGGRITLSRRFKTSQRTIPPAEYAGFQEVALGRMATASNAVYLEASAEKP